MKSDIIHLTKEKIEKLLLDWWSIDESDNEFLRLPSRLQTEIREYDEPVDDVLDSKYIPLLEEALLYSYYGVTNYYLTEKYSAITGSQIEVKGENEYLEICPCCGYRTIKERGWYEICPVCYWEDDGSNDVNRYSSPNHISIHDYRMKEMRLDEEMMKRYSAQ